MSENFYVPNSAGTQPRIRLTFFKHLNTHPCLHRLAVGAGMSAIAEFFLGLEPRGRSPLPPRIRGTLRIDLVDQDRTSHWYVDMTTPDRVVVTRDSKAADAVLTTTHRLFERLVCGEQSATAALFRNEATFAGDTRLILAFRRFFPSPAGTRDPREVARQHAPHGQAWRERLQTRIL